MSITPRLTLVGAGPGDPELISLKGARLLGEADVVLYDALIDERLLDHTADDCIRIYVGKRADRHSFSQQEINRLIVACAFNHGHVVRLKGGDPFVFGRGQEEKDYAEVFNIPVEVVPGISSATAVAASQSIPLTMRGVNEGFWVITATKSYGELSADIELAARSSATIVILMGIRKLAAIAEIFREQGKGGLPVAVVQNGTMKNEKYVTGTMDDIAARAESARIGSPGIIIAGEVVSVHPDFTEGAHVHHLQPIIERYG
jgi:uroporphyrin-III C-methyltransferase